jgi:signal transduction histidine kinase
MDWRGVHRPTIIAFLVLALFIVGAGFVIYRNVNRLSRLEYENQRRFLSSALFSYRRDFNGALLDLTRAFEPPIWTQTNEGLQRLLVDRYELLLEEGLDLNLLDELFLLVYRADRNAIFFRFDPNEAVFLEEQIPESIRNLESSLFPPRIPRLGRGASRLELLEEDLFLSVPQSSDRRGFRPWRRVPTMELPPFEPGSRSNPDQAEGSHLERGQTKDFLILLRLNRTYLEREIMSRLEQSYLRRPLLEGFELAIVSETGEIIVPRSDEGLDPAFFHFPDATIPLLAPGGWLIPFNVSLGPGLGAGPPFRQESKLNLAVRHRAGSLGIAIGQHRRRDLLEAFGILLLLAGAAITLVVSVQRTRLLARRQMDFVAGISHELRNPLTAIQSAGFNLSKGTVRDDKKIRKYGQIISRESRRLTHMVEQVLSYAGIQSSSMRYDRRLIQLEEIIESVLQEYARVFEDEDWQVKVEIEENLPSLSADAKALRSCLSNLIDNSLKYAAETRSLVIQANTRQGSRKTWIEVSVQDQGPGIASTELAHIFDPFYRGAAQLASSTPGTGLGLSLVKRHVEAHGGTVQVHSSPEGTRFLLAFPVARNSVETFKDEYGA